PPGTRHVGGKPPCPNHRSAHPLFPCDLHRPSPQLLHASAFSRSVRCRRRGALWAEITPVEPDPVSTGEGRKPVDVEGTSWGIEPVPERLRVLGFLDTLLLWGNLSISLLVIVLGAFLVPALSLKSALGAILIGALAGSLLLGFAGMIGADARVPGMVLLRAPLGQRGSFAPTVLNVAQNLGWSTFELIIISTAAAALSDKIFGFRERWLWAVLFGAVSIA